MKRITLVAYLAAKQCLFSAEHPDMREPYPGRHQCNIGAERRVGVRLSRAPDVAGCVAIPSYSPADSESAGFLCIAAYVENSLFCRVPRVRRSLSAAVKAA
jgi:hypothetical protein